jgi:hypothetical protein
VTRPTVGIGILKICGLAGAVMVLALASTASMAGATSTKTLANTAGAATTTHAVQPTYTHGNITACPTGTTTFINTSNMGPGFQSVSYSTGGTTFQVTVSATRTCLRFLTNSTSFTVYVMGGSGWDTYSYTGTSYTSDSGLHSPNSNGAKVAGISHYLVCGTPGSPA